MKDRLEQFIASENITRTQFADSIKVAPAGITHILSGRNKPGYEFIVNTMAAYPALNIEWLLTGKGTMYKDGSGPRESTPSVSVNSSSPIKKIVVFFGDNTYKEFY